MRFHHSKLVRLVLLTSLIAAGNGFVSRAFGQRTTVRISVLPETSHALIEVTCPPRSQWSFLDRYASVLGLGSRIEEFVAVDGAGREIPTRRLAPGQFESTEKASHIRYDVNLSPPAFPSDSAFVSWLTKDRGLLMMSDLLPLSLASDDHGVTSVQCNLREGWQIYSTESRTGANQFEVRDIDKAVFVTGGHLRTSETNASGLPFRLVADGDWAFSDSEVLESISKVLRTYKNIFGAMPAKQAQLVLFPFPQSTAPTSWAAETRGETVKLMVGKLPSKVGALAQISTPLTHELFHLWVPNGLALEADYDWFYEGFTVYQASRTAVDLGMLTFPEFLSSIARAFDASKQANTLSLIDASKRRFTSGGASVYAKGQVVAFICDLRLRNASRRKRSLADVYRKLLQMYSSDQNREKRSDGNEAVTRVLGAELGSQDLIGEYTRNPVSIDLTNELAPFGLKVETLGSRTYISVTEKLSKQQRELLGDLGYNDASRARRRN